MTSTCSAGEVTGLKVSVKGVQVGTLGTSPGASGTFAATSGTNNVVVTAHYANGAEAWCTRMPHCEDKKTFFRIMPF